MLFSRTSWGTSNVYDIVSVIPRLTTESKHDGKIRSWTKTLIFVLWNFSGKPKAREIFTLKVKVSPDFIKNIQFIRLDTEKYLRLITDQNMPEGSKSRKSTEKLEVSQRKGSKLGVNNLLIYLSTKHDPSPQEGMFHAAWQAEARGVAVSTNSACELTSSGPCVSAHEPQTCWETCGRGGVSWHVNDACNRACGRPCVATHATGSMHDDTEWQVAVYARYGTLVHWMKLVHSLLTSFCRWLVEMTIAFAEL